MNFQEWMIPLREDLVDELPKYYSKEIFKNETLIIMKRPFTNHVLLPYFTYYGEESTLFYFNLPQDR